MPAAPYPTNESQRLAAVRKVRLLGTPAEERFDKITRLARHMFDVQLAIIDIVGEKLAWLKSVQGFDRFQVDRPHSYCHYTILRDKVCLVEDARIDPRLHDNPFATSFVFYAGVPLKLDGQNVGVLCIGDPAPRTLTSEEMQSLCDLAALAEHELEVAALSEAQIFLALSNEELEMKAMTDVLTRTWSRRAIMDIAARELEQSSTGGTPTGIVMLDIDHFKRINDVHGHPGGDEVLRQVSARLRSSVRSWDAIGRYGGEEFLAVLPHADKHEIREVAERIRSTLARDPVVVDGKEIAVTCSLGCTLSADGNNFVDTLLRAADAALYRAKERGRNRVEATWEFPATFSMRPRMA